MGKESIIEYIPNVKFNLHNYLKYIKALHNNIGKILTEIKLSKYFKINSILINALIDNYNFDKILELYKESIYYTKCELNKEQLDELYDDDIRKNCE